MTKQEILSELITLPIAGWSSPVARQAHNLKVVGSNPTPAPNFNLLFSGGFFILGKQQAWHPCRGRTKDSRRAGHFEQTWKENEDLCRPRFVNEY